MPHCPVASEIFVPRPGIEPVFLVLASGFLTTGHQGSPPSLFKNCISCLFMYYLSFGHTVWLVGSQFSNQRLNPDPQTKLNNTNLKFTKPQMVNSFVKTYVYGTLGFSITEFV